VGSAGRGGGRCDVGAEEDRRSAHVVAESSMREGEAEEAIYGKEKERYFGWSHLGN